MGMSLPLNSASTHIIEFWLKIPVLVHPLGPVVQRTTCGLVVAIRLAMTSLISVSLCFGCLLGEEHWFGEDLIVDFS
tara:strand:- start:2880 stop:3110 length:231 start_codon:yes stop_codon:yes gene_type:complete